MPHVIQSPARVLDVIIDAEPWAIPYREDLRRLLTEPAVTSSEHRSVRFEAARTQATIARWNAGADAWRAWTEKIGALRARFQCETGADRVFASLGLADFSDHCFQDCVNFGTLEFPFGVSFARANFADDTWLADVHFGGRTDFCGAQFLSCVSFEKSRFEGDADFRDAVFLQGARFTSVCAGEGMTFRDALNRCLVPLFAIPRTARFFESAGWRRSRIRKLPLRARCGFFRRRVLRQCRF